MQRTEENVKLYNILSLTDQKRERAVVWCGERGHIGQGQGVWCLVSGHLQPPPTSPLWWRHVVVCGVMVDNMVQFFVRYVLACDCENIEELRNMVTWMCHIILKHTLRAIICNYMQQQHPHPIPVTQT